MLTSTHPDGCPFILFGEREMITHTCTHIESEDYYEHTFRNTVFGTVVVKSQYESDHLNPIMDMLELSYDTRLDSIWYGGSKNKYGFDKLKSHEQPLFKENLESPTSFDTLVALKYLHKKVQADNRGIEFTLSLSDMVRLMKAKRCYYTGVELTLDGSLGLSFDRLDSTLGYTRSNTISCSAIANTLKENLMESCDVQQHLSKKEIKKMLLKFAELL